MSPIKRAATKAAGPRQLAGAGEATTMVGTLRPEATSRTVAASAAASPFAAATAGAAEATTARAAGAGVPQQSRQFAAGEATVQQLSKAAGPSVAAQAAGAVAAACTPGAEASAAAAPQPAATAVATDNAAGRDHSLGPDPSVQQEQSKQPGSGAPQQAAAAPPASAEQAGVLVDGAHAHSVSRMNSMLTAVKHSIRAVLPRMLRRQLDGECQRSAAQHAVQAWHARHIGTCCWPSAHAMRAPWQGSAGRPGPCTHASASGLAWPSVPCCTRCPCCPCRAPR